jgi:hypothetical protein
MLRAFDIAVRRIDPTSARSRHLPLPEHGFGFQKINYECARFECRLAMLRSAHHQHDLIRRLQSANPMEDNDRVEGPPSLCASEHRFNAPFGHARIVFEFEALYRIVLELIPNDSAKGRHCAGAPRDGRSQRRPLGADVEILLLNFDARQQDSTAGNGRHECNFVAVTHRTLTTDKLLVQRNSDIWCRKRSRKVFAKTPTQHYDETAQIQLTTDIEGQ